jgi:hypothetical protein
LVLKTRRNKVRTATIVFTVMAALLFPSCIKMNTKGSITKVECPRFSPVQVIESTPQIMIISGDCSDYSYEAKKVYDAIQFFAEEYAIEFEVEEEDVWRALSRLKIQFSAVPKEADNIYDLEGNFHKKHKVSGLALDKNWIWVEAKTRYICESSLVHELIHIIIWREQEVHGDPDHEGGDFSGWTEQHTELINLVNEALCELEI